MKTKQKWQTCKEPTDNTQWITPPSCDGNVILLSYSAGEDGVIYRRCWHQGNGVRVYTKRFLADAEMFEPWQTEPE